MKSVNPSLARLCIGLGLVACGPSSSTAAVEDASPFEVYPTEIVRGPADSPSTLVELRLARALAEPARVLVQTDGGETLLSARPERHAAGGVLRDAVPLPAATDAPGETGVALSLIVTEGERARTYRATIPRPETGWVLHFVAGFHYDPVWWNTQANYTETAALMDAQHGSGFTLMRDYLAAAAADPDFRFVLHQLPHLKTFVEAHPEARAELRDRIREGRCELTGGTYNESQSTLISAEAQARNAIYGMLFQNEVLNGSASVFWQCDVFGHDPSFPSLMARSRHDAGAFARGPFHQWGAPRDQVNFPSEFLWMAPDGESILTHYMTGHYGYAYSRLAGGTNRATDDGARLEAIIGEMFLDLKRPALTHHVLLPLGADFIRPIENLGEVVRRWNEAHLSPRCVVSTPKAFFAAVREEVAARGLVLPVVTRDMNPIYTGCPVSFADLKLANRACEAALRDAEAFATIAALEGARYPTLAIDRAWRQLLFNSHHDGVTGSMSDQVYLDILAGYRDALEIATEVKRRAIAHLSRRVDTHGERAATLVWNAVAARRDGVVDLGDAGPGAARLSVRGVPALGYRIVDEGNHEIRAGATRAVESVLENEFLRVSIDVAQGGAISSVLDKRAGRECLRGPGNDVVLLTEYPSLPGHGEGPWHLAPTGERRPGTSVTARLLPRDPNRPNRITLEADYPEFRKRQSIELEPGAARVDLETWILDWRGRNQCLRVEFPVLLPGARPVFQTAAAVIGRPFSRDTDSAKDAWTLDQACYQWVDLGVACAVEVMEGSRAVHRRALGVGEIVTGASAPRETSAAAIRLAETLVKCGVTTTITREDTRRYGDLAIDSNVPDFRVLLGTPDDHAGISAVAKERGIEESRLALCLVEARDALPVLVLDPGESLKEALSSLAESQRIRLPVGRAFLGSRTVAEEYGVALVSRGPSSARVAADGTIALNLLRSSTGWPSGTWFDEPRRRLPDGAPLETMHGSHVFRYALVPHLGDFRSAALSRIGQEVDHPLFAMTEPPHEGGLPAEASFLEIEGAGVLLTALKPEGFPEARWTLNPAPDPPKAVVARLWNGGGREVEAGIRLRHATGRAWRGNLLEERLAELPVRESVARLTLAPNAYETVILEVAARAIEEDSTSLDPTDGDVSPSAYWLENLGEGVTGNGAIAIAPETRAVALLGGAAAVKLRVENNQKGRSAVVDLQVEGSNDLDVSLEPDRLSIEAGGVAEAILRARAREGTKPSRSLVTVIGTGIAGRSVSAAVWLEDPSAAPFGSDVEVRADALVVSRGGTLRATLRNLTSGPITGEATWLAPMALWPSLPRWRQRVTVAAGDSLDVECPIGGALDSFALLKFAYGGRLAFSEAIAVTSVPERVVVSIPAPRIRLRKGRPTDVAVRAVSVSGLASGSSLGLEVPAGWEAREIERSYAQVSGQSQRLEARFAVTPRTDSGGTVTLRATGPGGAFTLADASVVPAQSARSAADSVVVDGELGEWDGAEFTEASSDKGRVRAAVRHGDGGLALAFDVEDEVYAQPNTGESIWKGDSIQVGLSGAPNEAIGYGPTEFEFGVASTSVGPVVWCWQSGATGRTGPVEGARASIRREGPCTRYELFLPRAAVPGLPLTAGARLGFTYLANDDDGKGYAGAIEWTGGLTGGKDASLFGEMTLEAR